MHQREADFRQRAVVGPNAAARANLLGGWSVHWQGPQSDAEVSYVQTVAEAMRQAGSASVSSATGVNADGSSANDDAQGAARQATKAVMCGVKGWVQGVGWSGGRLEG